MGKALGVIGVLVFVGAGLGQEVLMRTLVLFLYDMCCERWFVSRLGVLTPNKIGIGNRSGLTRLTE